MTDLTGQILAEALRAGRLDWLRDVVACQTCGERQTAAEARDGCRVCGGETKKARDPR